MLSLNKKSMTTPPSPCGTTRKGYRAIPKMSQLPFTRSMIHLKPRLLSPPTLLFFPERFTQLSLIDDESVEGIAIQVTLLFHIKTQNVQFG